MRDKGFEFPAALQSLVVRVHERTVGDGCRCRANKDTPVKMMLTDDIKFALCCVLRIITNHRDADDRGFQGTLIQQAMSIINHDAGLPDVFIADVMVRNCDDLQEYLEADREECRQAFEKRKQEMRERISRRSTTG